MHNVWIESFAYLKRCNWSFLYHSRLVLDERRERRLINLAYQALIDILTLLLEGPVSKRHILWRCLLDLVFSFCCFALGRRQMRCDWVVGAASSSEGSICHGVFPSLLGALFHKLSGRYELRSLSSTASEQLIRITLSSEPKGFVTAWLLVGAGALFLVARKIVIRIRALKWMFAGEDRILSGRYWSLKIDLLLQGNRLELFSWSDLITFQQ